MTLANAAAPAAMTMTLQRQRREAFVLWALGLGFAAAILLSVGWGAVTITPGQVVAILADRLGLDLPWTVTERDKLILLGVRLPRTCLAVLTGAALAVCGAALQGLFRNPLAAPDLIGVSMGAALAAAATIVLGGQLVAYLPLAATPFLLPLAAFGGGMLVTLLVYRIANRHGRTDVATMLLAGVAMNAITAAGIGFLVFISDDQQLRDLSFWTLGSLGGVTWAKLLPAAPFIALSIVALPLLARHLNALLLGESEALHLGFHLERTKRLVIALAALGTGAAVALTGVIGFVGLVVPHLVRLVLGPDHRILLPASVLLGASLMLIADLFARTVALPAELPIGILTSCVGGPFFLWLLLRQRPSGGW